MPRCEICNEEKPKGYRVNPRTGQSEPTRFWCDDDFERVVARVARAQTDNFYAKKRRGREPGSDPNS